MLSAAEAAELPVGDAAFYLDRTARRRIKTPKSSAENDCQSVILGAASTCRLRRRLACVHPKSPEQLFQCLDHKQRPVGPISRRGIVAIIRKRAETAGIQGNFASQSLRIGGAELMAEGGATIEEIRRTARWRPWTTAAPYVRRAQAKQRAAAWRWSRHAE